MLESAFWRHGEVILFDAVGDADHARFVHALDLVRNREGRGKYADADGAK
jgi:hypothetical protein